MNKENEGSWSNGSDTSCEVNLKTTTSNANSTMYNHLQRGKHGAAAVFPSASLPQLVHGSPRQDHLPVSNECFGNMFGGIEETQEFWPWSEQQNFH